MMRTLSGYSTVSRKNKEKCEFRANAITYLGERLTADGVKPDEAKIKAIQEYTRPESKQDVLRLLGIVKFIAKFAPRISDATAHLRELTRKNVEFHWIDQHEKAFNDLKRLLTEPGTLRYYNVTKHVTLQVDASQRGLGAALSQDQGIKSDERNAATLRPDEKELLAVVFGCKHFHQYIYGKKVTIESDHKLLEAIFANLYHKRLSPAEDVSDVTATPGVRHRSEVQERMYLADALSRAFPPVVFEEQFERDIESES